MNRIVLSELALHDQEQTIDFYTDRKGPDLAMEYLQTVQNTLSMLAENPQLGSGRRFRSPELHGVRWFPLASPFEKHLVFYRAERGSVEILRVLHASRHIEEILENDS